ncbi:MAG: translation initiation factor IF-3 [Candidatus Nealsonbacteria bacterium CG23_combo_of_CG06-09_8_20_14_all_40_13]|uniref:Translation initiation factor IF-3 n=1 Tax=Candidatus Nealsonbacteria bacterium CG23_combo_of_CG06-09_8_20_14_all_40_13 TaxID=1974724 RepID=A0A2G9YR17_9BACT|nr:MAG: translation initiation factor IF-3 [Candidatus Nealsonbacteria bacterium CG23_combo_of_CG06-09_8_20_14_all_40_13]PIR71176.1 MAG: translation initiation factor IF-3 [Candidatus Nealsonbacteria bacterium CG10_big_fil_rev_8_21_14_0_10_40_24]PIU43597.1 MAG: translation initiation factor IF-3 [Candidatus Nealsonbacteria bacterium CG07_land_8_20_14_0_80_40_10]
MSPVLILKPRSNKIETLRKNQEITSPTIILVDEDGKSLGEVSIDQALYLAYDKGLDLVEVGSNARPPICKLINYGKYLYEFEKKQKKQKAKTKIGEVKEIQLSLKIHQHDIQTKAHQAIRFLDEGNKVKVSLLLVGREVVYLGKAKEMIEKFAHEIGGQLEQPMQKLGKKIFTTIIKNRDSKNA